MTSDILFERRGAAGVVTLNRQQALNAVTHQMVRALRGALEDWAQDPAISRVVVTAAPGRAFSAGGDIRALTDLGKAGKHEDAVAFWRDEYPLNARIKGYRKPYIALIDGIVMGGGVGISVHGSHRVVSSVHRASGRACVMPNWRLPFLRPCRYLGGPFMSRFILTSPPECGLTGCSRSS